MYYLNFKKLRYCKSEIAPKDYDFTVADEKTFEYPFKKLNLREFNKINDFCKYPLQERNVRLIFSINYCYILENEICKQTFEITETTGFKIGLYFGKDFNNFFDNVTVEKNKKVLLNTNDRKVLNEFIASFCDC